MKFLINDSYSVIRKGDFVVAAENANEFILETPIDPEAFSAGTLIEIAKANKVEFNNKDNKSKLIHKIEEHLMNDTTIPAQDTPTETQRVSLIVKEGIEAGKNDDAILIDIVTAGISFKKAAKLFKQVMESEGLRVSSKDRNASASEILAGIEFNPQNAADVTAAVGILVEKVKDTNEKQALSAIKKYAKTHEIELPKVEKGARGGMGGGFYPKGYAWILANPTATLEQFTAWLEEQERPAYIVQRFENIFKTVHAFHAQQTA